MVPYSVSTSADSPPTNPPIPILNLCHADLRIGQNAYIVLAHRLGHVADPTKSRRGCRVSYALFEQAVRYVCLHDRFKDGPPADVWAAVEEVVKEIASEVGVQNTHPQAGESEVRS